LSRIIHEVHDAFIQRQLVYILIRSGYKDIDQCVTDGNDV
jgi:hypothetical protein